MRNPKNVITCFLLASHRYQGTFEWWNMKTIECHAFFYWLRENSEFIWRFFCNKYMQMTLYVPQIFKSLNDKHRETWKIDTTLFPIRLTSGVCADKSSKASQHHKRWKVIYIRQLKGLYQWFHSLRAKPSTKWIYYLYISLISWIDLKS